MTAIGGGEARLAPVMPLPAALAQYVGMQIAAVHEHADGVVIEVRPVGHMPRRRILIEGIARVTDITAYSPRDRDDEQAQIDIGDEIYERERYAESDIDLNGSEDDPRTRHR